MSEEREKLEKDMLQAMYEHLVAYETFRRSENEVKKTTRLWKEYCEREMIK